MSVCAVVGAGPGLGLALARRFGNEGFRVAMIARNPQSLETQLATIRQDGHDAHAVQADASSPDSMHTAFARIAAELGDVDVLIYNASIMKEALPSALDPSQLVEDFKTNVVGAVVAAQLVLPTMRKNSVGRSFLRAVGSPSIRIQPSRPSQSVKPACELLPSLCGRSSPPKALHAATVTICGFIQPDTKFDRSCSPNTTSRSISNRLGSLKPKWS